MSSSPNAHQEQPFRGDGEIRALLRSVDWSTTPLGAVTSWPKSLIGLVHVILGMPTPAIIFWGPDYLQLYNEGYAGVMGPLHPKYFGAPCAECWPGTFAEIEPVMRTVLAGGAAKFDETHFALMRYGFPEETYFTLTFSPLRDDAGEIAGIFQPIVEVTESVLAKRRTQTLRELVPISHVGTALATLSSNARDVPFAAIYLWNDAERRLEVAAASDGLEGHDCAALHVAVLEAFGTGVSVRIDDFGFAPAGPWGDPTPSAFAVPLRQSRRGVVIFGISPRLHFDDAYRRFLESAAATFDDAGERAILVARESRAQREADLQKGRLASLFMQAPIAVAIVEGPAHIFTFANPSYRALVGGRDVVGKPLLQALPELRGQGMETLMDRVVATGEPFLGEEFVVNLDRRGSGVTEDVVYNLIYSAKRDAHGGIEGLFLCAADVTEQVRARRHVESLLDELKLTNDRKDEFLAMLAHELRNPMAAISLALQLLERKSGDETKMAAHRAMAQRQMGHLVRLVDDLLDVSRITQGKVVLQMKEIDLAVIVRHAVNAIRPTIEAGGHELSVLVAPVSFRLDADATRIEQVLVNLLTNAAKFTEPGGQLSLRLSREVENGVEEAVVRIRDNGRGIPKEMIAPIFELFVQASPSFDRSAGGLGLGLTLVRRLVEMHGGTVTARSEGENQGSEFEVRLPVASNPPLATLQTEVPSTVSVPAPRHYRILLVEDSDDLRNYMKEVLESLGHEVVVAANGIEGAAGILDWLPDVALVDLGLPGINGYEVARRVRADAGGKTIRLVALSGYGGPEARAMAKAAGFDEHINKPVEIGELMALLG